jgi:CDP-diacylglycerol pyrophosphatase
LQKLERVTGTNTSQLLEVATKFFVNQDWKARWEADRKKNRNVDLFAAALAGQSDGPQQANPGRGRGNP